MTPDEKRRLAVDLSFFNCPNCNGRFVPSEEKQSLTNIVCQACNLKVRFIKIPDVVQQPLLAIKKSELDRLLKKKQPLPPVIIHRTIHEPYLGQRYQEATFYPFIPYSFLQSGQSLTYLTDKTTDALLFLDPESLRSIELIPPPKDEEVAEVISRWEQISTSRIQRTLGIGYSRAARIKDLAEAIRRKKGLSVESEEESDEDE